MYRIYIGDMDKVQRSLHERYGPVVRIAPNEVSTTEIPVMSNIYKHQRPLVKTDFVRLCIFTYLAIDADLLGSTVSGKQRGLAIT
jgi:hypothetical protein